MADLNREFLAERDLRIFQMKKGGLSNGDIARRVGISTKAVAAAISRQLERMNQEAAMAYPEVLRMELERLDALQAAIWPLTQTRKVTLPDGSEAVVEPDLKATQQVLSIMNARAKLMGIERAPIDSTPTAEVVRSSLHGREVEHVDSTTPEQEARELLKLMAESGVLTADVLEGLTPKALEVGEIEDAELSDS